MEQEGQGQCKAYPECENDPGPDGLCKTHRDEYYRAHRDEAPRGWQYSSNPSRGMTCAELNEQGLKRKVFLTGGSGIVTEKDLREANDAHLAAQDNGGH